MKSFVLMLAMGMPAFAEEPKFTVKVAKADAPKTLAEELRTALEENATSVLNGDGSARAKFWLRKDIPSKATEEQVRNGLTYREIPEGTFLGVAVFDAAFVDFRKQTIPAGAYSLRLAVQPDTGDHKDTAPHQDFCLLVPIAAEKKLEALETKDAVTLSLNATGADHPAVLLLFPHFGKEADAKIAAKPNGVSVLQLRREVTAGTKKVGMGFAFVVDGFSPNAPGAKE